MIKRFVAIGLGLAIVPRVAVVDEVRAGQVVAVPIRGLPVREIGLVERTGETSLGCCDHLSPALARVRHTSHGWRAMRCPWTSTPVSGGVVTPHLALNRDNNRGHNSVDIHNQWC